jgi:hypothetical protein
MKVAIGRAMTAQASVTTIAMLSVRHTMSRFAGCVTSCL